MKSIICGEAEQKIAIKVISGYIDYLQSSLEECISCVEKMRTVDIVDTLIDDSLMELESDIKTVSSNLGEVSKGITLLTNAYLSRIREVDNYMYKGV